MDLVYSCYEQYNYIKFHNPEYLDMASAKYINSIIIMAKGYTKNHIFTPENKMLKKLRHLAVEWKKQNSYTIYISDKLKQDINSLTKRLIYWKCYFKIKKIYKGFHCRPRIQKIMRLFFGAFIGEEVEKEKWQFEIYGTERAKSYDRRFLILSDKQKPIFAYNIDISTGYGLYGGKWLINNIELFKNNKYMKKRKR